MSNPKPKLSNLKPFVKGDVRINRKGRPKSFDAWRKLNKSILSEIATDSKTGKPVVIKTTRITKGREIEESHYATNAEMIVRTAMKDKRYSKNVVEAAFGKLPQQVDVTSGGEIIKQTGNDLNRSMTALADALTHLTEDKK